MVDIGIVGDVANVLEEMIAIWERRNATPDRQALEAWWRQIDQWRGAQVPELRPGLEGRSSRSTRSSGCSS